LTAPLRVLIAKPGLDGHDRGAKVVARALRDAGMEVIYMGLRRRPEEIAAAALQEDVDVIGLSVLSGAHVPLTRKVVRALAEEGADIPVVVGGTIPEQDRPALMELGVAEVFPTSTPLDDLAERVRAVVRERAT
jgi:methylmalonyl-CoA mutase C-terminal domain/subunit